LSFELLASFLLGPLGNAVTEAGAVRRVAWHFPGTRDLAVLATRSASSTVDTPQSASNAIYHSYLSESRGGRSPTWLSEGGWAAMAFAWILQD